MPITLDGPAVQSWLRTLTDLRFPLAVEQPRNNPRREGARVKYAIEFDHPG